MNHALILAALLALQDEKAVADAAKATLDKGSFTFQLAPAADLKDALAQDRAAVAGVTLTGGMRKDGVYRSTDGSWDLYGLNNALLVKTADGWTPAKDVVQDLLQAIRDAAGKDEGSRGNVTEAKAATRRLLALLHLAVRSIPPRQLLSRLETDFKSLKKGDSEVIDGRRHAVYEGEMKDVAAHLLLQGPYGEYVKDGTLIISDFSGRGRVWVSPDGLVRRTEFKAVGKYTSVNKAENTRKTTPVAVSVTTSFLKIGETDLPVARDVSERLESMQADGKR